MRQAEEEEEGIQAKSELTVGAPGDRYEREADAVADRIMTMPDPALQRQELEDEEAPEVQAQVEGVPIVTPQMKSELDSSRGGGEPLSGDVRSFMEPRFGRDFSGVRVHTGSRVASMARGLRAQAFTRGSDVYFGSGKYTPNTTSGKRLLAHELAHTVQQGNVINKRVQRAETDTRGCKILDDTKKDVNDVVNRALNNARAKATNQGVINAQKVISELYNELGANDLNNLGRTEIETWAERLGSSKIKQQVKARTKYSGLRYGIWRQSFFSILNPTMRIKNFCIGSDKLGHFFQQGYDYYWKAYKKKMGEPAAIKWGKDTEAGNYGLRTTGVYSNADLEANKQGLSFYKALAANPSLSFDISQYINLNWNEENNPSYYEPSVGKTVWANLIKGLWKGGMEHPRLGMTVQVEISLNVINDISVKGEYEYEMSKGDVRKGRIEGTIHHKEITVEGVKAIKGVKIDFKWEEVGVTEYGQGSWISEGEGNLKGKWGEGTSNDDRGGWIIFK